MTTLPFQPLNTYDWPRIARELDAQGWALLPGLFDPRDVCCWARDAIAAARRAPAQAGHGDQYALPDPLPAPLRQLRADLYRHLLPVARAWAKALGVDTSYPDDLDAYTQRNSQAGQRRALSAIQRLRADDYQPLLMHADGDCVFPLRLIALLSEPGQDYTGGEVVMTEQRPRMQSRPMVLPLQLGDAAVIATSHRPVQGAQGTYRVTDRQAISRVRHGERLGLDLMLHDAP